MEELPGRDFTENPVRANEVSFEKGASPARKVAKGIQVKPCSNSGSERQPCQPTGHHDSQSLELLHV